MPKKGEKLSAEHLAAMKAGMARYYAERKKQPRKASSSKLARQRAARDARNAARSEELADFPATRSGRARVARPRGRPPMRSATPAELRAVRLQRSKNGRRTKGTAQDIELALELEAMAGATRLLTPLGPDVQAAVVAFINRHF